MTGPQRPATNEHIEAFNRGLMGERPDKLISKRPIPMLFILAGFTAFAALLALDLLTAPGKPESRN